MIIIGAEQIPQGNVDKFAWAALRRFHNEHYLTDILIKKHNIGKKHFSNAKKQSNNIRYYLMQGREYFEAAKYVSLVTKPVLLYYSIMCLATAEILFKMSGDVSLDRAREKHRHHGLEFICDGDRDLQAPLVQSAGALRARPAIRKDGERYGTFELWHQVAREAPLVGDIRTQLVNSKTRSFNALFLSDDVRQGYLPSAGVTLFEIIQRLPGMYRYLHRHDVSTKLVRSHVERQTSGQAATNRLIFHPDLNSPIEDILDHILINGNDIGNVNFFPTPGAGILTIQDGTPPHNIRFRLPPCTSIEYPDVYFWANFHGLNEFGFLYLSLYIAGNYARYWPDWWIKDIEISTNLGLALEELMVIAENRIPLLTLSEFTGVFYVPSIPTLPTDR